MENQDIKVLLLNIKTNIIKVEVGQYSPDTLMDIEKDFLDVLELIKLFMISRRDTYYGFFMMNLKFKVNFYTHSIAGILLNTYPPVLEANPLLLCKWTLQEIIYVICHEIEHVILNHPAEMVKMNPQKDPNVFEKFNIAADASVNDRLDSEIAGGFKFMATPKSIITSKTLSSMYGLKKIKPLENYLYYYNLIKDKEDEDGVSQHQSMVDEIGDQTNSDGQPNQSDVQENPNNSNYSSGADENGESGPGDGEPITSKNASGKPGNDHNWSDDSEEFEDIFANTKEFINQSFNMIPEKNRGSMPANFISEVERFNAPPKIKWQSVLKKYIGTISADRIHTRTRLNRRQPERFDLSGKINDKILKIVVAIDTSGSVNDKQIAEIFNEIFGILAKRKYEITVIECDAAIQRIYKVKKPSDVKHNVLGRGGTSFVPVIKYINQNKCYRDCLLIYFTDGWGDSSIPKPLTYRNLWVITDGGIDALSLKEPYGAVISMEE